MNCGIVLKEPQHSMAQYTLQPISGMSKECTGLLWEKSIAMRLYAKCPTFLWDEFYMTAAHLHGKTKTSAVNNIMPSELWCSRKPKYSYIHETEC